mgnify:CR=1 FL=1
MWYNRSMKKVTVQLTVEWTFDQKQWSEEKKHIDMLINDPKLCFGYDTINSLFVLNDLDYPTVTKYTTKEA